ncbi:MAG: alginate export family protein [Verrucomicrobiales bacterium]
MMLLTNKYSLARVGLAALSIVAAHGILQSELSAGTVLEEPLAEPEVAPSALDFITNAKLTGDFRLRYEYGDQDPLDDSNALTLRSRIGILTGEYAGFQGFAEYEGTLAADRDSYRSGRGDGKGSGKTIIADPESHELNRLWLSYTGFDSKVKVGRQRIILDNARFVGNVGWRQNEQTFDAVTVTNESLEDIKLYYGYIWHTQRIFGSETPASPAQTDFDGSTHLVNAAFSGLPNATIATYAYFMDLDNDAGSAQSNNTYGAYINGAVPMDSLALGYRAEYAYQTDGSGSPLSYGANYYHLQTTATLEKKHFAGIGYESLEPQFRTPLATLHAFNGFADKFLVTPPDGLADLYVFAGTKLPWEMGAKVIFHWFGSQGGSLEYGSEVDLVLTKKINENVSLLAKYANYFADDYATDTQRASIEVDVKF